MDYHLINGVVKYMNYMSHMKILASSKYYYQYKFTYLYKKPIIHISVYSLDKFIGKDYKYIVHKIDSLQFFTKIINSKLNIIGMLFNCFGLRPTLNRLPQSLKKIKLGSYFSDKLDNLPKSLKSLKINSNNFNQKIDNLPHSLNTLYIRGTQFDQTVTNLPKSLKKLVIIGTFSQNIDLLPDSIRVLRIISLMFNQQLNNLPKSLKELQIGNKIWKKRRVTKSNIKPKKLTIDMFDEVN